MFRIDFHPATRRKIQKEIDLEFSFDQIFFPVWWSHFCQVVLKEIVLRTGFFMIVVKGNGQVTSSFYQQICLLVQFLVNVILKDRKSVV